MFFLPKSDGLLLHCFRSIENCEMSIATDKIDPQPVLPRIVENSMSAEGALSIGNYPLAYAAAGHDNTKACAELLCGAIAPGLKAFGSLADVTPEERLIQAYGLWCQEANGEATDILAGLGSAAAASLASFISGGANILVFTMPDTDISAFEHLKGFRVYHVALTAEDFGKPMEKVLADLPADFEPAIVLSLGAFGPYLPDGFHQAAIPSVFWVGDHDYFFTTRYADLSQADVIIVNSAGEHQELSDIYDARIAAIPGHEGYGKSTDFPDDSGIRDTDIMFTGRAFTPYMRDKAQFLFRLATMEKEGVSIQFRDGYLETEEYVKAMNRAKFVPLYWRYAGGIQTRAIDALRQNAAVLSPESPICAPLLGGEEVGFLSLYDKAPEKRMQKFFDAFDRQAQQHVSYRQRFRELFWPSPERESRFLKFCLLQTVLRKKSDKLRPLDSATPVELRGYGLSQGLAVYTPIMKKNSEAAEQSAGHLNYAMAAIFYAAILVQDNQKLGELALDLARFATETYPTNLALRFNAARAFWTFGLRDESIEHFSHIVDCFEDMDFDPQSDALFSHRVRPLADMFSYGDYYRAVMNDQCSGGNDAGQMILSAVLTYIGLAAFESGDNTKARDCCGQAIALSAVNFPAHGLNARISFGEDGTGRASLTSFYQAVNLYPPLIDDLLAIGLAGEMAGENKTAAQDLIRHWVLYHTRVRSADGQLRPIDEQAIDAAKQYRDHMPAVIAKLFDELVEEAAQ